MKPFRIDGDDPSSYLEFRAFSNTGDFLVEFRSPSLSAERKIEFICELAGDVEALVIFFETMARNWKGWEGECAWQSMGDDLKLSSTHNHIGNVKMKIEMT